MTIKTRIHILYLGLFALTSIIFLFAKTYVVDYYVNSKLENVFEIIKNNPNITVGDFQFKIAEEGLFIYPQEDVDIIANLNNENGVEIIDYSGIKNVTLNEVIFDHDSKNDMIKVSTHDEGVHLANVEVSKSIVKDIVDLVGIIFVFMTLFYTIVFFVIDNSFDRLVIKPLKNLENNLRNVGSSEEIKFMESKYGSTEISKINIVTSKILKDLSAEIDDRNKLLQAISHELKTPVANINAILDLHIKGVGRYKDQNAAYDMMQNESSKLVAEINKLVEFNSIMSRNYETTKMELGNFVMQKLYSHPLTESAGLRFTYIRQGEFLIDTIEEQINFIFDNIVYNLFKYAKESSKVIVLSNKDEFKIINIKAVNAETSTSTKVGNQISVYFAAKLNLEFIVDSGRESYMTSIRRKE